MTHTYLDFVAIAVANGVPGVLNMLLVRRYPVMKNFVFGFYLILMPTIFSLFWHNMEAWHIAPFIVLGVIWQIVTAIRIVNARPTPAAVPEPSMPEAEIRP